VLTTHRIAVAGTIAIGAMTACGSGGGGATFAPATLSANSVPSATPSPTAHPSASPVPTATPASTPSPVATITPAATPTPAATATPTPVATATPAPGPTIQANPAALAFTSTGPGAAQQLNVSEPGYIGTFSESDSCDSVATISPFTAVAGTPFTVTPLAPGACTITMHDTAARSVAVSVTVTSSGLVIQRKGRS